MAEAEGAGKKSPVFEFKITMGEVLTSVTILISVITLSINWHQERVKDRKERADKIRFAAAEALARLERWHELSSYQNFDPVFVEASETLAKSKDARGARDFLWKSLIKEQSAVDSRIAEEKIEVPPIEIYSYNPALHEAFICTIRKLKTTREEAFQQLLADTQGVVFAEERKDYDRTEVLGNALREQLRKYQKTLQSGIDPAIQQTRAVLVSQIIMRGDSEVDDKLFTAQIKCEDYGVAK